VVDRLGRHQGRRLTRRQRSRHVPQYQDRAGWLPDSVPKDVDPATIPKPLDPSVANHVAAVVLFGTPNVRAMNFLGQPQLVIGPLYQSKTIEVCATEDPVCSDGANFAAHNSYVDDGSVIAQGADFAASRLQGAAPSSQVSATRPGGFGN
jgi:cutinase